MVEPEEMLSTGPLFTIILKGRADAPEEMRAFDRSFRVGNGARRHPCIAISKSINVLQLATGYGYFGGNPDVNTWALWMFELSGPEDQAEPEKAFAPCGVGSPV
jgi:hypothetical protein